ncbi:nucleotidyltransferase family protein [Nostoc parmelioides]|uniref:Nucleotidyltransferase family protein n=1 Tax=Nostoc parmelioides FACHB-3921 TaxID=2692909 RepID=A0ABR8BKT3_9NOSO|nr:nucleotidyltransferase family protein [Nostoc parmelioides]MBD2254698.1 nucleotidyltransferase family protein [Nostoc parmelioides FACHB-3921]
MKTFDELKQVLSLQKQSLCEIYQITEIGIFGSYARGEQTEASDIDILVDYETAPTFIMLVELRDYLSQLFGLKVDIVTKNGLKPRIRDRVLAEAIYI